MTVHSIFLPATPLRGEEKTSRAFMQLPAASDAGF
jgi:hypothetical protein